MEERRQKRELWSEHRNVSEHSGERERERDS
jgi:hypothetical protein